MMYKKKIIHIPFTIKQGKTYLPHTQPTPEDLNDLPIFDLVPQNMKWQPSDLPNIEFNQSKINMDSEDGTIWNAKTTYKLSDEKMKKWCDRLYTKYTFQVKKTLEATTQLAIIENPNESWNPLTKHMKRSFLPFKYRRIKGVVCTDTIVLSKPSIYGYRYF